MSIFVTEHAGVGRLNGSGVTPAALASYAMTSAGAATPNANTSFIRVSADAVSFLGIVASTTTALSSTNAFRVPANAAPELFAVPQGFKLMAAST